MTKQRPVQERTAEYLATAILVSDLHREALAVFHETGLTPRQLAEQRAELMEALKIARECIAYCRRAHNDAQSGEGIPVEIFIDAALAKAGGGGE